MSQEIEYSTSKAHWHTEKMKSLRAGLQIVPTEIQVDLEAWCNDNCGFCSYRKEDGYNNEMLKMINGKPSNDNMAIGKPSIDSRIPDDIVLDLPRQMVEAGIPAIEITGGGEPTLHPKFTELLQLLGEKKLDIAVVTNGSKLTPKNIELMKKYCIWIRISMDASNPETHRKIHHTPNFDFERRVSNIKKLLENKRDDLIIGISFIITPENVDDIESAARLFALMKVNHIRFSWMFDKQGTAGLTTRQIKEIGELVPRLQEELNTETFKIFNEKNRIQLYTQKNDFKKCSFQRFVMVIGADSGCYPCCIMKYNMDYQYGNLKDNTLKEIVHAMNTDEFMKSLDPARCYPCWLSPRNTSINNGIENPIILKEKPLHVNFI